MTYLGLFFLAYLAIYLCGCTCSVAQDVSVLRITAFGARRAAPILVLSGLKKTIYFGSWLPGASGIAICHADPAVQPLQPGRAGLLLNTDRAARVWALYRRHTTLLVFACQLQAIVVFALAPLVAYTITPYALVFLFPVWLFLHVVIVSSFIRLTRHRTLRPATRAEDIATLMLSPPLALRASAVILRELFSKCHWLAVVNVVCTTDDALRLSAQYLRDLEYPTAAEQELCDSAAQQAEAWKIAVRSFLASRYDTSAIWPVKPATHGAEHYCPRCGTQFTTAVAMCDQCGIKLLSFQKGAGMGVGAPN